MFELTSKKMDSIANEKKDRAHKLNRLTTPPFVLSNKLQMAALEEYIDNFELNVNRMFLMCALAENVKGVGISWLVSQFIAPDFIKNLLGYTLYYSVAGFFLEQLSRNDFHQDLEEMKQLYNWVMKEGRPNYTAKIDNTEKLKHPEIERMIELIGPLCSPEFMIVWPDSTKVEPVQGGLINSALNYGSSWYHYGSSFFGESAKDKTIDEKVVRLKERVERGQMQLGFTEGLKQAAGYFSGPKFTSRASAYFSFDADLPFKMLSELFSLADKTEIAEARRMLNNNN